MGGSGKFQFSIDRGGTFTDVYCVYPDGTRKVTKLLSVHPSYPDAPREAIRRCLEEYYDRPISKDELIPTADIGSIRMGTTVATNALLERKGAKTAFITSTGLGDVLMIGNQSRPGIFDLKMKKVDPVYDATLTLPERCIIKDGEIIPVEVPARGDIYTALSYLYNDGFESLAVCFMHSYGYPHHERLVKEVALEIGFTQVSLSSDIMPMVKIVPRGLTTCVDAYLTPAIQQYIQQFKAGFDDQLYQHTSIQFMQSDGGLTSADGFTGAFSILSGPAGGVVGYGTSITGEDGKYPAIIGFDMGGTSSDVSRYSGELELVYETEIAGVAIQAPQLAITTVAAGGGSILKFINGLFVVGPESAGARPGPICYGFGGDQLTVTDANLMLGRIVPDHFPHLFGKDEKQPLDYAATETAFQAMTAQINAYYEKHQEDTRMNLFEVAFGFITVANAAMIRPIRSITEARGYDPSVHTLASFGGAGGQHACSIAKALGMEKVFIHAYAGILSAYGLSKADVVAEVSEASSQVYDVSILPAIEDTFERLGQEARSKLKGEDYEVHMEYILDLRYAGTNTSIRTAKSASTSFLSTFESMYEREFGFMVTGKDVVIDNIRVRAIGKAALLEEPNITSTSPTPMTCLGRTSAYFAQSHDDAKCQAYDTPLYPLSAIQGKVEGPCILIDDTSTIVVEPGCHAYKDQCGNLHIEVAKKKKLAVDTSLDRIRLSLFANRFMSIAEQMGRTLQRTAISTNIKERLDFSCALFGPRGDLIANAPHLPVHLGAMQEAVRYQISKLGDDWKEGEVVISNHPTAGGSHLPDITVMTPVFANNAPVFFVASRGHHADIGGISPGSMPPFSKELVEEGACIESLKVVEGGVFQEGRVVDRLLAPGKLGRADIKGTRCLEDNLSDLKAQVAANQRGIYLVKDLIVEYGLEVVLAYMDHVANNAEQAVRDMLRKLAARKGISTSVKLSAKDQMDDGTEIQVEIAIDTVQGSAVFDFTGTGPQVYGNLNAPRAVTMSAVIYCLRCLVDEEIPLNQGCMVPIEVIIPDGSILAPSPDAGVVGGNVLTSQRVTEVILLAFEACANSQGCMNNLTFGNEGFGYYETIAGGGGAGPNWNGEHAVHSHMTNTRITDCEVMERRYPVKVNEFSIRTGSGGKGAYIGGDGCVREIAFLEEMQVSILSERRAVAPRGLGGGGDGSKGKNELIRKDGRVIGLGGKNSIRAYPGDRIRLLTPGGGGYGA